MDADRFDTLARALSAPRSRRAALSSAAAGGLLSALGLTRAVPETRAAQGGLCVVAFTATTQRTGEITGTLSFSLSGSGNLDTAALTLPDGTQVPVVGQATGHALQLRIALGAQQALVAVGVGEQEISRCQGAIDGVATGSQRGDLGDWHATAGVQNIPGGGQGGTTQAQSTAAGARGATAAAGSTGQTGRAGDTSRRTTGSGAAGTGAGSTVPSCPSGETYCPYVEECRDLRTSSLDCGACGTRCPSLVCQEGRCLSEEDVEGQEACPESLQRCPDGCRSFSDETNCGGCGIVCPQGTTCQGGVCAQPGGGACPSGTVDCGSDPPLCVDTLTNPSYCGLCSISCASGEICQGGECTTSGGGGCLAGSGLTYCNGVCVNLMTDPGNCSECGTSCGLDQHCENGECIVSGGGGCKAGSELTYCAGVCVNLNTDPANCGSCGFVCGEGTTCQGSVCVAAAGTGGPPPTDGLLQTCDAQGLTDCGGGCVNLQTDPANCGECGVVCEPGTTCQVNGCIGTIP